jgi:translation initiation factor IF-1
VNSQQRTSTTPRAISILALSSVLPIFPAGCEDVALVGRPILDARSRADNIEFTGTVEEADHNRHEIYLRTEGGQSQVLTYTDRTRVIINGEETSVSRINRGDVLEVRMYGAADGRILANSIRVRKSGNTGSKTIEGTVERVLSDRGVVEVRTASGDLTAVYLPQDASERTREEFRRLRPGDFVQLEGFFLGEHQFELTGGGVL